MHSNGISSTLNSISVLLHGVGHASLVHTWPHSSHVALATLLSCGIGHTPLMQRWPRCSCMAVTALLFYMIIVTVLIPRSQLIGVRDTLP